MECLAAEGALDTRHAETISPSQGGRASTEEKETLSFSCDDVVPTNSPTTLSADQIRSVYADGFPQWQSAIPLVPTAFSSTTPPLLKPTPPPNHTDSSVHVESVLDASISRPSTTLSHNSILTTASHSSSPARKSACTSKWRSHGNTPRGFFVRSYKIRTARSSNSGIVRTATRRASGGRGLPSRGRSREG